MTTFVEAVNEAMKVSMNLDTSVLCYGLGVDDPKRIFGTTNDLKEEFGPRRVFDMPTAENAMLGIGIGAAIGGFKPVFVNQRFDFVLLAMDQLVNAAAKWHYMFGAQATVPLVMRVVVGRGWGQGPTHSQSLHAWLAHVPGLKVVMPTTPADAKGLLISSIMDPNPVVFIEHRWLHNMQGDVPEGDYRVPLGQANLMRTGNDVTIVSNTLMSIEAQHALDYLSVQNISGDIVDLRTVRPIDWDCIFKSVEKTGRLAVLDIGNEFGSIASEIIAKVVTERPNSLKAAPVKIAMPDHAVPTSFALTKDFYPDATDVARGIGKLLDIDVDASGLKDRFTWPHDVPGNWFSGPF